MFLTTFPKAPMSDRPESLKGPIPSITQHVHHSDYPIPPTQRAQHTYTREKMVQPLATELKTKKFEIDPTMRIANDCAGGVDTTHQSPR